MLGDICDVCGRTVTPAEVVKAEVSTSQMMCPTSMTFHRQCFEAASALWQLDDSYCGADPDFPEMQAWASVAEPPGRVEG